MKDLAILLKKWQKTKKLLKATTSKLVKIWAASIAGIIFTSCNVTRQVTTQSEYFQKGDTAVTIVTKTVETYDASKKF